MSENKKVKNASKNIVDGIEFKSLLESRTYQKLKDSGFSPEYEHLYFNLMDSFYPYSQCFDRHYDRSLKKKVFGLNRFKIQAITYTPDFTFTYNDRLIVIECKGKENDVYPIKKKLFRRWMDKYTHLTGVSILYFEVHSLGELEESIEIIRSLN